jgi:adenine C2-methylase RlmN of 23S rRNA A2503 and tRNA A37
LPRAEIFGFRSKTGRRARPDKLSIFDRSSVEELFERHNINKIWLRALYSEIVYRGLTDLAQLIEFAPPRRFPRRAFELIIDRYVLSTSTVQQNEAQNAFHGCKMVIKLHDVQMIESVIIDHADRNKFSKKGRNSSLCVSSQVGCKMQCTFCATGGMNRSSNLFSAEILEQIWHAQRRVKKLGRPAIRNIVFMGMGEPMDNYAAVVQSVHDIKEIFGIAYGSITVSTVGMVPRIAQLAIDCPGVKLALSLHAPTQELRVKIVPSSRSFTVEKLMEALDSYQTRTKQVVMIEYILIADVNSSVETANQLGRLLQGRQVWINIIPYNPTSVGDKFDFKSPTPQVALDFRNEVTNYKDHEGNPLFCKVRWSSANGRGVDGACGQLALKNIEETNSSSASSSNPNSVIQDIEDTLASGARAKTSRAKRNGGSAKAEEAARRSGGHYEKYALQLLALAAGLALLVLGIWS